MPAGRGVLYIVWGAAIEPMLQRSIASVKAIHPELPVHVERVDGAADDARNLAEKTSMFARSPFAETLFLDADTVVLDRLDYGFEKARQFGLACCICEAPWARRYKGLAARGDLVEYNTGVLFFSRAAEPVFSLWVRLAREIDSSVVFLHHGKTPQIMSYNDQASFAAAVDSAGVSPFVLPLNWNFRWDFQKSFFGPVKIWHSYRDVPAQLLEVNAYYRKPNAVIQYAETK